MNEANNAESRCEPSTRSRVIGFEWYDGVTEGIAADDQNNNAIAFRLLARNLDPEELYIYGVASLDDGKFAQVLRELKSLGPPRWPVWVPIWKFDQPKEQARVDLFLEKLSIGDAPVECVVICTHILEPYLAKREVTDEAHRQEVEILRAMGISFQEWVDYVASQS